MSAMAAFYYILLTDTTIENIEFPTWILPRVFRFVKPKKKPRSNTKYNQMNANCYNIFIGHHQ
jgi:hypothetical protein